MKQLTTYKANQNKVISVSINNSTLYKNLMWRLLILILLGFITTITIKAQPVVKSIVPASGPVGSSVTISGSHFDTAVANNIVYFGAVKATVTSASDTSLTVTVPSGATYQPVSVINLSTNLSGTSANPFNVTYNGGIGQTITSSSFNTRVNFTSGLNPADIVAVADIDGDGKPDMVVVNRLTNTFSVFRNTSTVGTISTASFAAKVDFVTDSTPSAIAFGDLDGDGKLDIVITNMFLNRISVYRNISSVGSITTSSFAAKVNFITDTLSLPTAVAIGDLDGDGKPDLAVTNSFTNTVSVLKNMSTVGSITTSSFAAATDYKTGLGPTSVAIADIDGDGKPDLAVTNFNAKTFSVFRNKVIGNLIDTTSFATKVDFTTGTGPHALAVGDLNGDGKSDIVVANQGSNTISVFSNNAVSGTITTTSFAAKVDVASGGESPYYITIANIDGDNKPDILTANLVLNNISVIKNNYVSGTIASTSFSPAVNFGSGNYPFSVAVADFDGDGKPDLAVPNYGNNNVSVYKNALSNIVPVTFLSFTGQYLNPDKALLKWQTATETNTAYFNIQRSSDAAVFKTIGKQNAVVADYNYTYTDLLPSANTLQVVYYRLQVVDNDGLLTYSPVVSINIGKNTSFSIFPNPAKNYINIQSYGNVENAIVVINDIAGHTVLTNKLLNQQLQQVSLSTLSKGIYMVSIITSDGKQTQKIVVE